MRRNRPPRQRPQARLVRLEKKLDQLGRDLAPRRHETGKASRFFHRLADGIEGFSITRIIAALGIWLFLISIVAFVIDLRDRREERQARTEEREFRRLAQIATAWEVLLTPVGGDIGKGNALNTLIASNNPLEGADFSCAAIGVFQDGNCKSRPVFNGVDATGGHFWEGPVRNLGQIGQFDVGIGGSEARYAPSRSALNGANLNESNWNGLQADGLEIGAHLSNVTGFGWTVRNALPGFNWYSGGLGSQAGRKSFEGFWCQFCSFHDSILPPEVMGSLEAPSLSNILVPVPFDYLERQDDIPVTLANASGAGTTFLDRPVMYVWSGFAGTPETQLIPEDGIIWDVNNRLSYCVDQDDAAWLLTHWSGDQKFENVPDNDRHILEGDIERLKSENGFDSPAKFPTGRGSVEKNYTCYISGLSVAPLLKIRLFKWFKNLRKQQGTEGPYLAMEEYLENKPVIVLE